MTETNTADNTITLGDVQMLNGGISYIHLTAFDLWLNAWSIAGKSLLYMTYLHPEMVRDSQYIRVCKMCYHLAKEHNSHFENTPENREWFQTWITEFENEVENQC